MIRPFCALLIAASVAACGQRSIRATNPPCDVTVVAGKREGPATYYWISGKVAAKGQFLNDEATGLWTYTWEEGGIQCRGTFNQGKQDGPWVFVRPNGEIAGEHTITALKPGETDRVVASWVPDCPTPTMLYGTGGYERGRRVRDLDATEVAALLAN